MLLRLFLLTLLLGACATPSGPGNPAAATTPPPSPLRDFTLEARFSLRVESITAGRQQTSGRLLWTHRAGMDQIEFMSPLGQTVAELTFQPGWARLRTPDGKTREAGDARTLLEENARLALPPLDRLPDWLQGQGGPDAHIERDEQQRPTRLADQGWRIEYDYPTPHAQALPRQILVRQDEWVELRLRIDTWQAEHD